MSNVWECLNKSTLIDLIGESTLDFAEEILPEIANEIGKDYSEFLNITNRQSVLAELFEKSAMSGSITKKDFRKALLEQLSPEYTEKLLKEFNEFTEYDQLENKLLSSAWIKSDLTVRFCKALDISVDILPIKSEPIPDIEVIDKRPQVDAPFKQLKDYQFVTVAKAYKELEKKLTRFMIQMPTGSGKTRVAMEIVCNTLLENKNKKTNIVWLANREELLEQAYVSFKEVWAHLSDHEIDLIRFFGKAKNNFNNSHKSSFAICGLDKLLKELETNPDSFDEFRENTRLMIFDEAHGIPAPTYKKAVVKLMGKRCSLVGLSATPGRNDSDEQSDLTNTFNNNLIPLECNGINPIEYLKAKGVLSKTNVDLLKITSKADYTKEELLYLQNEQKLLPSMIKKLGKEKIRNIEIIKTIMKYSDLGKKIIVFALDLDHSRKLNAILNFIGIKSTHIDGETGNRKYILDEFKNDKIQVICNGDLLAVGFDSPKIDVVMICRPVGSMGLKLQMIGRGLRGPQMGGTEYCTIIDIKDSFGGIYEAENIYDEFSEYFTSIES